MPSSPLDFHFPSSFFTSILHCCPPSAVLLGPGLGEIYRQHREKPAGRCAPHSLTKKARCQFDAHPRVSQNVNELL